VKNNFIYTIAILAVVGFAGFFAYSLHGFFVHERDGRLALENSEAARGMFEDVLTLGQRDVELLAAARIHEARELAGNGDIVAFISIPGTAIGDMVVHGGDNYHYLRHDAYGAASQAGALFLDYRNAPDFNDPSSIIYGHNMRNGSMFHDLRYFMEQDFFERHPRIALITEQGVMFYEIFSAFSTTVDFDYIQTNFKTPEDFEGLVDEIVRRSVVDSGITVTRDDRMLILSTCNLSGRDRRFVVAARLI